MRIEQGGTTLQLTRGDIAAQPDLDAIVNAANAELTPGGGVAGAIHRAAGPGLAAECRPLAPIRPGEAVITGAHALPNDYVVHTLGPVYGRDLPSDRLLASAYETALRVADEHGVTSIGLPAISTGAFGYPMEEAANVALGTCLRLVEDLVHLRLIRFVFFSEADLAVHQRVLERLTADESNR